MCFNFVNFTKARSACPRKGKGKMKLEKIVKVKKFAVHKYGCGQCETAIYAKTARSKRYKWYIGFGVAHIPADKKRHREVL